MRPEGQARGLDHLERVPRRPHDGRPDRGAPPRLRPHGRGLAGPPPHECRSRRRGCRPRRPDGGDRSIGGRADVSGVGPRRICSPPADVAAARAPARPSLTSIQSPCSPGATRGASRIRSRFSRHRRTPRRTRWVRTLDHMPEGPRAAISPAPSSSGASFARRHTGRTFTWSTSDRPARQSRRPVARARARRRGARLVAGRTGSGPRSSCSRARRTWPPGGGQRAALRGAALPRPRDGIRALPGKLAHLRDHRRIDRRIDRNERVLAWFDRFLKR